MESPSLEGFSRFRNCLLERKRAALSIIICSLLGNTRDAWAACQLHFIKTKRRSGDGPRSYCDRWTQVSLLHHFGGRWERRSVYRMFMTYKKLAGIDKHGGVHVFGRHSMGSLLVKGGCDIETIKELMRHSDIHTTMRYLHVSDVTKRAKAGFIFSNLRLLDLL